MNVEYEQCFGLRAVTKETAPRLDFLSGYCVHNYRAQPSIRHSGVEGLSCAWACDPGCPGNEDLGARLISGETFRAARVIAAGLKVKKSRHDLLSESNLSRQKAGVRALSKLSTPAPHMFGRSGEGMFRENESLRNLRKQFYGPGSRAAVDCDAETAR